MNRRRLVLQALGAAALAGAYPVVAQRPRVVRIAYLSNDPSREQPTFRGFESGLRDLGWIEGKNIEILFRTADGDDSRYPHLAADIVREGVDVIVTTGSPATKAARAATDRIPIVFGSAANPVEQKFVTSLARPGGNITGLALLVQELGPKRLQMLKEMLPQATRFARFYDSTSIAQIQPRIIAEEESAAHALGITVRQIAVTTRDDIGPAMAEAARSGVQAMHVTAATLFVVRRKEVCEHALENRMPILGPDGRFADVGALASYGENFAQRYRRAAGLVDKILKGTKPGEIPVEQPATLEFVVNLRTANALKVTIPQAVMVQAERVVK